METKSLSKSLKTMAVGESVVGYIKGFIKAPKSSTPDQEHPVLVTQDGKELVFWASGDVTYIRERMSENNVDLGVLCKITKEDKPAEYKGRKKYFAKIGFKRDDVKPEIVNSTSNRGGGTDADGFEF